jgi:SlyX protein
MTQSDTGTDARLVELEARVAHQDHAVLELGNEVYRQQQQIARLESIVGQLADRLSSTGPAEPAAQPADEIPPHY